MPKNPLDFAQDAVFRDYQNVLGEKRAGALHLFFSPWRIPIGLTDDEAEICANLLPLKEAKYQRHKKKAEEGTSNNTDDLLTAMAMLINSTMVGIAKSSIPEEFRPGKKMTRARFQRGIKEFLLTAYL